MPAVPRDRRYRRLFTAQVIALVGTGLATVALSLLADDIAGPDAGSVLGTALAIKMAAYVGLTPVISALAHRLAPRPVLVAADLIRAAVALALPFVTEIWQVYLLIFLLQAASATFTPAFQALIPRVLPGEEDYTRALSLSRLAYDLEVLLSPVLAAALLAHVTYGGLFLGTVAGFLGSAALVLATALPPPSPGPAGGGGFAARTTRGARLILATPRLRALLALNLAVAAAGAMVLVNTIVYVRGHLGRAASDVPTAFGAYGAGSVLSALLLPRLLRRTTDRTLMLTAGLLSAGLLTALAATTWAGPAGWSWPALLALWAGFGATGSLIMTPTGRLVRRSAGAGDLTAVFAAQFSLSHGCWLFTYPLAGRLGAAAGLTATALALAAVGLGAALLAWRLWPTGDPSRIPHVHSVLGHEHPHLAGARPVGGGWEHTHHFVIDDLHRRWPLRPAG